MKSVLIIANDEKILTLMGRALENNFKVYSSTCSLEALDSAISHFPDLIILEAKMPQMDGYELCSQLKTNSTTQNIPVVFMSHKVGTASRSLAYRLGAIHYLERPFDLQELSLLAVAIVAQTAGRHSENILEYEDLFLDVKNYYCEDDHGEYKLTRSECLLLEALMRARSDTVGREILANRLNGHSEQISYRTVDSHICSIRKKIKNSGLHISSVYNVGYRLQKA